MKISGNFSHKISLGQNFLVNRDVICRSVEAGNISSSDVLLEIGAGQGALTRELLASPCAFLHSVEIDRRLEPWLVPLEEAHKDRCQIIWGNALDVSFSALASRPTKVMANIPYNITSPLIKKVIEELAPLGAELIVLMIQKEAADRLAASPGTKDRCPLGITLDAMGAVFRIMQVSPGSFNPPPKVSSSLIGVRIERNRQLAADALWNRLLNAAFAQRRKTLYNNLIAGTFDKNSVLSYLDSLNLAPTARAEELSTAQWLSLWTMIREQTQNA